MRLKKLKAGIADYRKGFSILRKKATDYTEQELLDYKCYVNSFCTKSVNVLVENFLLIVYTC